MEVPTKQATLKVDAAVKQAALSAGIPVRRDFEGENGCGPAEPESSRL